MEQLKTQNCQSNPEGKKQKQTKNKTKLINKNSHFQSN